MARRSGKNGPFRPPAPIAGGSPRKNPINANSAVQALSAEAGGKDKVARKTGGLTRARDESVLRLPKRAAALAKAEEALQAELKQRQQAEEALRQLSGRLLKVQEEERRRLAHELHGTLGQNLAALEAYLAVIEESVAKLSRRAREAFAQSRSLARNCLDEIRTVSYLLYPPLLDERGLGPAVRWYAKGFTQRSGIPVEVEAPPTLGRMPHEVEAALFRIVQESLTNIRRHAGSPRARIDIFRKSNRLTLEVKDEGHGFPDGTLGEEEDAMALLGVGIRGMRERMRQLGGRLEIQSSDKGTTVRAILPLSEESS